MKENRAIMFVTDQNDKHLNRIQKKLFELNYSWCHPLGNSSITDVHEHFSINLLFFSLDATNPNDLNMSVVRSTCNPSRIQTLNAEKNEIIFLSDIEFVRSPIDILKVEYPNLFGARVMSLQEISDAFGYPVILKK